MANVPGREHGWQGRALVVVMRWLVLRPIRYKFPPEIEAKDMRDLERTVQGLADTYGYGELEFDEMTDQVDVYFFRGPKIKRFMTLVPA